MREEDADVRHANRRREEGMALKGGRVKANRGEYYLEKKGERRIGDFNIPPRNCTMRTPAPPTVWRTDA